MVRIILLLSLTLLFEITYSQDSYTKPEPNRTAANVDPVKAEKAKAVALKFIRHIAKGEYIDSIMDVCAVPFSLDRKEVISERAALKQKYVEMIEDKGKNRVFIIDKIYIRATRKEMLDDIIPIDVYLVMVNIKVGKKESDEVHGLLLAVQMSDTPKIIGLSD